MDENVETGKIFVGGISWETKEAGLKAYFSKYGEVAECVIMREAMQAPNLAKHRGFGFVTFKDPSVINSVLEGGPHMLDNKKIDPKLAQLKTATHGSGGATCGPVKKIFVGGIAHGTSEDDLRALFSQFGTVTDVDLKFDKATQRMRGFGFVGFESEECVEKIVQIRFHQLSGKTVECKRAEPRFPSTGSQGMRQVVPPAASGYGAYPQGYAGHDYRNPTTTYGQQYNYGSNGAAYGYGYGQSSMYQGGYSGQYGSATNYGYEGSGYPRTQSSSGDSRTVDSQSSYYNYGQNAHQIPNYTQDTTSYPQTRSGYAAGPEGFGQQSAAAYTDYNRGGTTQQRGYATAPPYR